MKKHWKSPHSAGPYDLAVKGVMRFRDADEKLDALFLDEVDWKGLHEAERLGLVKTVGSEIGFVLGSISLTAIGKDFHAALNGNPVSDEVDRDRRRDLVPYAEVLAEFGKEIADREARPPADKGRLAKQRLAAMFEGLGYRPDAMA
ncbi:hypothetical protein [Bosea robiniae]|uniref:Uncharacterized protein n=1 Tax=Bosea robiniae TaxID=1036780 RepID=A0ABY0PA70_9HYPH|nr:hypothetical protein [Bosea robiniae]SDH22426.1 hypothetical protein SAMN05421844_107208 [Bosea robiniae]